MGFKTRIHYWLNFFKLNASPHHPRMCGVRSLLRGRDLLIKGLRWQIGFGHHSKVFKDPWLICSLSFKLITISQHPFLDLRVSDRRLDSEVWNEQLIKMAFWDIDHDEIK